MRLFYVIAVPVIWASAAITSYFHPGDEYALFAISAIAGSWVCFCMENIGHLRDVLWIIVVTGVIILAIFGFAMDRLRVSKRLWGILFGLCFTAILIFTICQYPSLDRAIRKNGSITAYVAGSVNLGLYLSLVLALIVRGITEAVRRLKSHKTVEPSIPGNA